MSYEKAYNKALERAKKWYNAPNADKIPTYANRIIVEIFPELGESEDERIRKALVRFHKSTIDVDGIKGEEIVAWLEKQGEQKPTEKQKEINYAEEIKKCKDNPLYFFDKYVNIKLKEQKPIIVEPKFKVGDWITDGEAVFHITSYDIDYGYQLETQKGTSFHFSDVNVENKYHLWTTQDAKPGDVLYSLDSKQPFIFKHRKTNEQAAVYCGINTYGKFFIGNTKDCVITTDKYIPADKFQRDLLFKKMQKAGYEWDAEKKELKLLISNGGDFESNNSMQKPSWSEEDERMCQETIDWFEKKCFPYALEHENPARESIMWLRSLKERLS